MKIPLHLFIIFLFLKSCFSVADEPLKVGIPAWTPYDFFFLAELQGYYKDHNIQLIDYNTPSEAVRAYKTGMLDVVLITNHLFIKMNDRGLTDRIILAIDYSSGSDVFLVDHELSSAEELIGKRIAAEASALGIFVLLRCLDMHGLNPKEIAYVPMDVSSQPAAFKNGSIEGVITYEPFATRIRKMGGIEFCNSKLIPFEICDLLVARPKVIKQKKKQLTTLCRGFYSACKDYNAWPGIYLPTLTERARLTAQEYKEVLNGVTMLSLEDNRLLFGNPDSGLDISITQVNRMMIEYGLVNNQLDITKLIDNSIIEAIENEGN